MVPVTVTTYWYDNYGLAVLQQPQDLMRSQWFVGLLILKISALIITISSVTLITTVTITVTVIVAVTAMSLAQQVYTAQCVNTMSKNVSLVLATQEVVDGKQEVAVDALEEVMMHVGTKL